MGEGSGMELRVASGWGLGVGGWGVGGCGWGWGWGLWGGVAGCEDRFARVGEGYGLIPRRIGECGAWDCRVDAGWNTCRQVHVCREESVQAFFCRLVHVWDEAHEPYRWCLGGLKP